jgi:hypothetical protein
MEARIYRAATVVAAFMALGASYRTPNFVVTAPTAEFAAEVGNAAEKYRRELAVLWLGRELPRWAEPCPIFLQVGPQLGAGGATSFVFDRGEVFGWHMTIQGTPQRILDSVLPHEVTHTILASHFRRPLPRWADEGACTTVEHESERRKQQQMLVQFLQTGRGIGFSQMFAMRDYPPDVMPLYSQGYSLCKFLIMQGGRQKFVDYIGEGLRTNQWGATTKRYYGYDSLAALQSSWVDWVRGGSPILDAPENAPSQDGTLLVASDRKPRPDPNLIYRAQSEDRSASQSASPPGNSQPGTLTASTQLARDLPCGWHARGQTAPSSSTIHAYPKDPPPPPSNARLQQLPQRASARDQTAAISGPHAPPANSNRQVILEWSRSGAGQEAVMATPMRQEALYDASRPGGTLWR